MLAAASKRARAAEAPPPKPAAERGGLEQIWKHQFDSGLDSAVGGPLLAAATADGAVTFMIGAAGRVVSKWEDEDGFDDVPNVMAFVSRKHLMHCSEPVSSENWE